MILRKKYFADKYSYEDFKNAYDMLSQNTKEFTELKIDKFTSRRSNSFKSTISDENNSASK